MAESEEFEPGSGRWTRYGGDLLDAELKYGLGAPAAEIAEALDLSERTVRDYARERGWRREPGDRDMLRLARRVALARALKRVCADPDKDAGLALKTVEAIQKLIALMKNETEDAQGDGGGDAGDERAAGEELRRLEAFRARLHTLVDQIERGEECDIAAFLRGDEEGPSDT